MARFEETMWVGNGYVKLFSFRTGDKTYPAKRRPDGRAASTKIVEKYNGPATVFCGKPVSARALTDAEWLQIEAGLEIPVAFEIE